MTDTRSDDGPVAASKKDAAGKARAMLGDDAGSSVVGRAVTIGKPVAEVYAYFRDFANLPTFMENVVAVEVKDATTSHWVVKAPAGRTVEWDAKVTDEAPKTPTSPGRRSRVPMSPTAAASNSATPARVARW